MKTHELRDLDIKARELAKTLSPAMRTALPREGVHRDCTSNTRATFRALAKRELGRAWQPYCVGSGRSPVQWRLSELGHAVVRILAEGGER